MRLRPETIGTPLPGSDWMLIASAAVLLTLAYPPFPLVVPAFVCLIPAALLVLRGSREPNAWRLNLHQGFWYGTITHGALLYWLAVAFWGHVSIRRRMPYPHSPDS
jgi:apolipoprotein N-acyltransferase